MLRRLRTPSSAAPVQAAPRGVKPNPNPKDPKPKPNAAAVVEENPLVVKGGLPKNLRGKPCLGMLKLVDAEWHLRTDDQYVRSRGARAFSSVLHF